MTDQELQEITDYLNGQLIGPDLASFEAKMANDVIFREKVSHHQKIEQAFNNTPLFKFVGTLQDIAQKHQTKELTYTLEQLINMFGVVEEYEAELALAATRSSSAKLQVVDPQNAIDVKEELVFNLALTAPEDLELIIENNSLDEVGEHIIPAGSKSLTISTNDYLPGRYYWKLISDSYDTIWGYFFIQKDLMPE